MIVTFEHIRKVRPIADNIDDEIRILPYMEEVEALDLIPAIGAGLYKQLNNGEIEALDDLLNGCYFSGNCGQERRHEGLIKAVAYLSYARFVRNNQINVTAFGATLKTTQFSEPIDEKMLIRHSNEAEKIGQAYLNGVIDFLRYKGLLCTTKKIFKNKFKAIGD